MQKCCSCILTDSQSRISAGLTNCTVGWWGFTDKENQSFQGKKYSKHKDQVYGLLMSHNWIWVCLCYRLAVNQYVFNISKTQFFCKVTMARKNFFGMCCEDYIEQPRKAFTLVPDI